MDRVSQTNLEAAFKIVAGSDESIDNPAELRKALQIAGFNPSHDDAHMFMNESKTDGFSYKHFCDAAKQCRIYSAHDIVYIISEVLDIRHGCFKWKQLQDLFASQGYHESFDLSSLSKKNGMDLSIDINLFATHILKQTEALSEVLNKFLLSSSSSRSDTSISEKITFLERNSNTFSMRGSFYLDKESIVSHQYSFSIKKEGKYVISIKEDSESFQELSDMLAFIFKEEKDGTRLFDSYTNCHTEDGLAYTQVTLTPGKYVIIPFTSGCQLQKKHKFNNRELLQLTENDGKFTLTTKFQKLLQKIFKQIDLNNNGLLDRQEFNLYNWRTSGEIVQDDEWNIVLENFDVKSGELTEEGFISLHQMEAEDNNGDAEDLWLSLEAMGFNKQGDQTEAAPFIVSLGAPVNPPELQILGLKSGGLILENALIKATIDSSEQKIVDNNPEILYFVSESKYYASVVIQNQSSSPITCKINCSKSSNCLSKHGKLVCDKSVQGKSSICAQFLVPEKPLLIWKFSCQITCL